MSPTQREKELEEIAHKYQLRYGCAPGEPTIPQLERILSMAADWESRTGRQVDDEQIKTIVHTVVSSAGTSKYASLGYQSMRDLLVRTQQILGKGK